MLRILIIDDDRDLAASIAEYLELDGYQVDTAFTASAGIEAATIGEYDQIIMDVGLPDMNGIDGMRAIRRACNTTSVLLITGYSAAYLSQTTGMPDDGVELLTKPLKLDALSHRLALLVAARTDRNTD